MPRRLYAMGSSGGAVASCSVGKCGEAVGVNDGSAFPAVDPAELEEIGVVGDDEVGVGVHCQVENEVVFRVGAVVLGSGHVAVIPARGPLGQCPDRVGVGAEGLVRPVTAST